MSTACTMVGRYGQPVKSIPEVLKAEISWRRSVDCLYLGCLLLLGLGLVSA